MILVKFSIPNYICRPQMFQESLSRGKFQICANLHRIVGYACIARWLIAEITPTSAYSPFLRDK